MMKKQSLEKQKGVVLVTGLIFLALMTLAGVTAMRTSILDERIAGNIRDTRIAFEEAEAALLNAERDTVYPLLNLNTFDGARTTLGHEGRYSLNQSEPANNLLFTPATWAGNAANAFTGANTSVVNTAPRWMIKVVQVDGPINLSMKGATRVVFRITARGTGGSDQTQVVLRTHFGKIF